MQQCIPSDANACPNRGIPIISGFPPNYGAGFAPGDGATESRNDAKLRNVKDSDLYDDVPDSDNAVTDGTRSPGFGSRLREALINSACVS